MIYLLDTNAISDLMRVSPPIEKWLSSVLEDDRVVTCTIVRGEILFGIARLAAGKRRIEQLPAKFRGGFLQTALSKVTRRSGLVVLQKQSGAASLPIEI